MSEPLTRGGMEIDMISLESAYHWLFVGLLLFLSCGIVAAIIRSVMGPRIADRIIAVNMAGTLTVISLAVLSVFFDQSYLVDVCLIYVLISFLAVVIFTKVFLTVYLDKKKKERPEK